MGRAGDGTWSSKYVSSFALQQATLYATQFPRPHPSPPSSPHPLSTVFNSVSSVTAAPAEHRMPLKLVFQERYHCHHSSDEMSSFSNNKDPSIEEIKAEPWSPKRATSCHLRYLPSRAFSPGGRGGGRRKRDECLQNVFMQHRHA